MMTESGDENKYWFKRRRYGWGWIPVTWQGWSVTLGFIALSILIVAMFSEGDNPGFFFIFLLPLLVTFISIAHRKGPKPKWRWGKSADDNPEEDF